MKRQLLIGGLFLVFLLGILIVRSIEADDAFHEKILVATISPFNESTIIAPGLVEVKTLAATGGITLDGVRKTSWDVASVGSSCDTHIVRAINDLSWYNCSIDAGCTAPTPPFSSYPEEDLFVSAAQTACSDGVCSFFFSCDQHATYPESGWSLDPPPYIIQNISHGIFFFNNQDWFVTNAPERRVWVYKEHGELGGFHNVQEEAKLVSSSEFLLELPLDITYSDELNGDVAYHDMFCTLTVTPSGQFHIEAKSPPLIYQWDEGVLEVGDNSTVVAKLTLCD
ncbi:MAG: hypothetical protein H6502_03315 [Candidatus Woesearchaeota archaeon]|nr:MAG: hypothetical protein H6502_03315 [Candidatus Woesearchaeota archaeon]